MSSATPGVDASTYDDDDLMTARHKEQLAAARDRLVENMYPDDVLNRLQSRKVLNARDVTRIKDKTQIDGQVELLLDTLMRKPDRAFTELFDALIASDQKHVAKLLVKEDKNVKTPRNNSVIDNRQSEASCAVDNEAVGRDSADDEFGHQDDLFDGYDVGEVEGRNISSSGAVNRKRRAGAVRVSVSAADVELDGASTIKRKPRQSAVSAEVREKQLVAQLNVELLETTLIEVRNLQKVALSGSEPRSLTRRKTILRSIRALTRYRREIVDVSEGSVIFSVRCQTIRALTDLRTLCLSGRLLSALHTDFVTVAVLAKYHLRNFSFVVSFSEADYRDCMNQLTGGDVDTSMPLCEVQPCAVNAAVLHHPFLPYSEILQHKLTPPLAKKQTSDIVTVSPDSGISSLPSPVSLPDNCLAVCDAMVLRSQRLVRMPTADSSYEDINRVVDMLPEFC